MRHLELMHEKIRSYFDVSPDASDDRYQPRRTQPCGKARTSTQHHLICFGHRFPQNPESRDRILIIAPSQDRLSY